MHATRRTGPLALVVALVPGCLTPPAIMPARNVDGGLAIRLYPEGTEAVELALADGTMLRGLFVPAEPGAPVVLHLLEASGSAEAIQFHYYALCEELADLGYASLLLDYTGVGGSSGERSPRHLERDAKVMWAEAVRRAGGAPGRVVVRGISIGTLAAAHLLAKGARPAATILVAPVRAETAVQHLASRRYNALVGFFAGLAYADVTDVDLVETLARASIPVLVVEGNDDFFLDAEERSDLRATVEASGGAWDEREGGHISVSVAAHRVLGEELDLLEGLFPGEPDGETRTTRLLARLEPDLAARFDDPVARKRLDAVARHVQGGHERTAAAIALAGESGLAALRERWRLALRPYPSLPFDALVEAVSQRCPLGTLPQEWVERFGLPRDILELYGSSFAANYTPELVGYAVQAAMLGRHSQESVSLDLGWDRGEVVLDLRALVEDLRARGGAEDAVRGTAALVLLHAQRIPARWVRIAAGPGVEVWSEGAWKPLDLDPPVTDRSVRVSGSLPRPLGRRARELLEELEE